MQTVAPGGASLPGHQAKHAQHDKVCTTLYVNACAANGSGLDWQYTASVCSVSEQEFTGHQVLYVS